MNASILQTPYSLIIKPSLSRPLRSRKPLLPPAGAALRTHCILVIIYPRVAKLSSFMPPSSVPLCLRFFSHSIRHVQRSPIFLLRTATATATADIETRILPSSTLIYCSRLAPTLSTIKSIRSATSFYLSPSGPHSLSLAPPSPTANHSLLFAVCFCDLQFAVCCLLPAVHFLLSAIYCLLLVACFPVIRDLTIVPTIRIRFA